MYRYLLIFAHFITKGSTLATLILEGDYRHKNTRTHQTPLWQSGHRRTHKIRGISFSNKTHRYSVPFHTRYYPTSSCLPHVLPYQGYGADILTKAVPCQQFKKLQNLMGIHAAWGGVLEINQVYKLAHTKAIYIYSLLPSIWVRVSTVHGLAYLIHT